MKKTAIGIINFFIPHRNLLLVFSGFFLATTLFFKIDADYTEELFTQLAKHIAKDSTLVKNDPQQLVIAALKTTHKLMDYNRKTFQFSPQSFKSKYMRSTDLDLLDVTGACGSTSLVLARTLMSMNFPVRIGQMKVNGSFGGHMLIEVWYKSRWAVLDPLYNQYFLRADSTLASFKEVSENFNYYKQQLLPEYDRRYTFEDVRYTNWDRIPLLSRLAKNVLDIGFGKERADRFCARKYIIKIYYIYYITSLVLLLLCTVMSFIQWYIHNKIRFNKY